MAEYFTPIDIANRALQHLGARSITAFTDQSKNAKEMLLAYDKIRIAELRRNTWRFTTRRTTLRPIDSNTLLLAPPLQVAATYYQPGAIVADANGALWQTSTPWNNTTAGSDPSWFPYFGPLTAGKYVSGNQYSAGEAVWTAPGSGSTAGLVSIYLALQTTSNDPTTVPAYSGSVTYSKGQTVSYSGSTYTSLVNLNTNNTPASSLSLWVSTTTYASGNQVTWIDGRIYTSASNGNVGNTPAVGSSFWTAATSTPYIQPWYLTQNPVPDLTWAYFGDGVTMELAAPGLIYPAQIDPMSPQNTARSVYRLPSGFLRMAPQAPKSGIQSYLGAPGNQWATDRIVEGNYIVTSEADAITIRFVADFTNVRDMDTMFCEGLAARLAYETCEVLTQSTEKRKECIAAYKNFMGEARLANSIETGTIEPIEDDYIMCRV